LSYPFLSFLRKWKGFRILLFHHVAAEDLDTFKEIIEFVGNEYGFVTPQEFENVCNQKEPPINNKYLISFDDGFLSSAIAAKKVLEPAGIKALFFICPNFIGLEQTALREFIVKNLLLSDEQAKKIRAMSWSDIKELRDKGNIIGAHTVNHLRLSSISNKEQKKNEIVKSKKILEGRLGVPIEWFAFPFGDYKSIDKDSLDIIQREYRYCCTGIRGLNNGNGGGSSYVICRDEVGLDNPLGYTKLLLKGGLDFYYYLKRKTLEGYLRE